MKRILMMVLRNLVMVPYAWIRLCYRAAHVDKYSEEDMYSFLKWIEIHVFSESSRVVRCFGYY